MNEKVEKTVGNRFATRIKSSILELPTRCGRASTLTSYTFPPFILLPRAEKIEN